MEFSEGRLRCEVKVQALMLQQGLREHNLPYECIFKESDSLITIELLRKGEQIASFNRSFTLDMASVWLESLIAQLARKHVLLTAEVEYLDLAVKFCKKLAYKSMIDISAYLTIRNLANHTFDRYDMLTESRENNNNVLDVHELIAARKAADNVAKLIDISER